MAAEYEAPIEFDAYRDSIPPVASKLAVWIWVLALLAMLPLVGVGFGVALGVLSLVLLGRHPRLEHDRPVALAGLVVAFLSALFAGVLLLNWVVIPQGSRAEQPHAALERATDASDIAAARLAELPGENESADDTQDTTDSQTSPSARTPTQQMVMFVAVLVISVILHEIAHAVAACWAGDSTARDRGRFSLNPLEHIDPIGSVVVPAIMAFTGSPVIGWAKPVPINPRRFRHPRRANLGVSLAGVSLNLFLALLASNLLIAILIGLRWVYPSCQVVGYWYDPDGWRLLGVAQPMIWQTTLQFLIALVGINTLLTGFNLLPIPPLDGFNAIRALLPRTLQILTARIAGLGFIILFGLIALNLMQYLLVPGVILWGFLLEAARTLSGQRG